MADQIQKALAGIKQLRSELVAELSKARNENNEIQKAKEASDAKLESLQEKLAQFDAQFPAVGDGAKVSTAAKGAKRGRKPGKKVAKKATKKAAAPKAKKAAKKATKKAAPKAKAKKGRKPTKNVAAAEGRRAVARGDRPVLKEAMKTVMGDKVMAAQDIVDGLKAKGWLPNAKDPRTYISFTLSAQKDAFERTEKRGYYRVRKNGKAAPKKPSTPKAAASGNHTKKPKGDVDKGLAELGIGESNVAANPFG